MPADNALALRDIHLPETIVWWPPAIGWWILVGLLMLLALLAFWLHRRYQGRRLHTEALQALMLIQTTHEKREDDQQLIRSLSIWLRRVCISHYPARDVAGLTGMDWLLFLDKSLVNTSLPRGFSQGPGKFILSAPYQQNIAASGAELLLLCRTWIMTLTEKKGRFRARV